MTFALHALLQEAANRLDMAFCLADNERVAKLYAQTRDKIREELKCYKPT